MYKNIIDNPYGGFILLGKSGTVKAAVEIAKGIVGSELNHPDIHIICPEEGSTNIKLAQMDVLRAGENKYPLLSKVNVFIIEHADYMTEDCQSTLLKVLEDGCSHNCILLCCERRPLETICNRCSIIFLPGIIPKSVVDTLAKDVGVPSSIISAVIDGREERLTFLKEQEGVGSISNIAKMLDSFSNIAEPRDCMFIFGAMSETGELVKSPAESILAIISGVRAFFEDMLLFYNSGKCKYSQTKKLASLYRSDWCLRVLNALVQAEDKIAVHKFTHNDYVVLVSTMSDKDFGCN